MSKKTDFNEGIGEGIKIAEKLIRKEAETMDYLKAKIDKIVISQGNVREAVENILNYQNDLALEKYYGLCNTLSPKDMDNPEQNVLLDILSTLAINGGSYNKSQKLYFANLKRYLNLKGYTPNSAYEFYLVENIRNLDAQEIIVKCILEFLFLGHNDFVFLDDYSELFDLFSIKNKKMKELMGMIDITYFLFGDTGIVEMYGCHVLAPADYIGDSVTQANENEEYELNLEQLIIDEPIEILENEVKVYKEKVIHIRENISCAGKLIFNSCKVLFYENACEAFIDMKAGSYIEFQSCVIKGYGMRKNNYFISSGNEYTSIFNQCIIDETAFLLCNPCAQLLQIENCTILNCFNLVQAEFAKGNSFIKNCFIELDHIPEYVELEKDSSLIFRRWNSMFDLSIETLVYNCKFIGKSTFEYKKIKEGQEKIRLITKANEISNCTFENLDYYVNGKEIKNCIFSNCTNCISIQSIYNSDKSIRDCLFKNCRDIMSLGDNVSVLNCQFISCSSNLINADNKCVVESCQFYNIDIIGDNKYYLAENATALLFSRTDNYSANELKNCEFKGINAGNGFIIAVDANKEVKPCILYMNNCTLNNALTKRSSGSFIKARYEYFGLFNRKKNEIGIYIDNRDDFENVENDCTQYLNYKEKSMNIYGDAIGSALEIQHGINGIISTQIYQDEFQ